MLNSFVSTRGEKELINCIERDLFKLKDFRNVSCKTLINSASVIKILINWLNQLIASLDCYTSLFKENMIDFKLLQNPCSR